jgi:hypothetical protein
VNITVISGTSIVATPSGQYSTTLLSYDPSYNYVYAMPQNVHGIAAIISGTSYVKVISASGYENQSTYDPVSGKIYFTYLPSQSSTEIEVFNTTRSLSINVYGTEPESLAYGTDGYMFNDFYSTPAIAFVNAFGALPSDYQGIDGSILLNKWSGSNPSSIGYSPSDNCIYYPLWDTSSGGNGVSIICLT